MSRDVLVIAEQTDGVFRKVAFEALSEGKRMALETGSKLVAALPGFFAGKSWPIRDWICRSTRSVIHFRTKRAPCGGCTISWTHMGR